MILTQTDTEKLNSLIGSLNPNQFKGLTSKIKSLYPEIYADLKTAVRILGLKNISEAIYLVVNKMEKPPECENLSPNCTHRLEFKTINEGYTSHCKQCSSLSEDFKLKRKETNMDKYGTEFPNKNPEIRRKISLAKTKFTPNVPLIKRCKYRLKKRPTTNLSMGFQIGTPKI